MSNKMTPNLFRSITTTEHSLKVSPKSDKPIKSYCSNMILWPLINLIIRHMSTTITPNLLEQHNLVTDGRTNGQTDAQTDVKLWWQYSFQLTLRGYKNSWLYETKTVHSNGALYCLNLDCYLKPVKCQLFYFLVPLLGCKCIKV